MSRRSGGRFARVQSWLQKAPAIFVASSVLAACAGGNHSPLTANGGKLFSVTAQKTAFFKYGPQQGNGPDSELPRDTLVTLIRPSFGYSKVQLVNDGQQGFVASDDIKIAPATLVAALTAPPPDPTVPRAPGGKRFRLNTNDPRLAPPPEQLPDPDLPPESSPR
ncbi:MAG: hypothetical protein H0U99_06995 [Chthoniobacterales bacterium]|nr:hypothetical protein [Chthoniobacterales bacterium]